MIGHVRHCNNGHHQRRLRDLGKTTYQGVSDPSNGVGAGVGAGVGMGVGAAVVGAGVGFGPGLASAITAKRAQTSHCKYKSKTRHEN